MKSEYRMVLGLMGGKQWNNKAYRVYKEYSSRNVIDPKEYARFTFVDGSRLIISIYECLNSDDISATIHTQPSESAQDRVSFRKVELNDFDKVVEFIQSFKRLVEREKTYTL